MMTTSAADPTQMMQTVPADATACAAGNCMAGGKADADSMQLLLQMQASIPAG
jgi:hypothetical protein